MALPIPPSNLSGQLAAITRKAFLPTIFRQIYTSSPLLDALAENLIPKHWDDSARIVMRAMQASRSVWYRNVGQKMLDDAAKRYSDMNPDVRLAIMRAAWREREKLPANIVVIATLNGGIDAEG
jgi:hypothetical protein